jgi:hypothetical protein
LSSWVNRQVLQPQVYSKETRLSPYSFCFWLWCLKDMPTELTLRKLLRLGKEVFRIKMGQTLMKCSLAKVRFSRKQAQWDQWQLNWRLKKLLT